jgi:hypothetical protein
MSFFAFRIQIGGTMHPTKHEEIDDDADTDGVQHIWSFHSHTIICHGILHYASLSSFKNKGDIGERR